MSLHVLPVNDLEEHEEETTCKCEPRLEIVNSEMLIIHNAFDQREILEKTKEILMTTKGEVMRTIQEINLQFPNCDDGTILSYEVGKGGVTEIREALKNGEYAQIKYYEIYKGDFLYAELHHFSQIIYKESE